MNQSTPYVIETYALSKTYKNVQAFRSLDLKVHQNSIFGFLGANGAGKTTAIRLLLGLLKADSDSVEDNTWLASRGVFGSPFLLILLGLYRFICEEFR